MRKLKLTIFAIVSIFAVALAGWKTGSADNSDSGAPAATEAFRRDPVDQLPSSKRVGSFTLRVMPEQASVQICRPVYLQVQVINTGKTVQHLVGSKYVENDFFLVAQGPTGDTVPATALGRTWAFPVRPSNNSHFMSDAIQPGDYRSFRILVNSIYDMSRPGDYMITVKRIIDPLPEGSARPQVLVSEPVKVIVKNDGFYFASKVPVVSGKQRNPEIYQ